MTHYTRSNHTVYHHRYHIVWITKYRYRILSGEIGLRARDIISQAADELGIKIINGVVSKDHLHLFVSIPPHISVSQFVQKAKGRSSRKLQEEFPQLRKRYWGRHFWCRGYFSTTSGNVTDKMIDDYIENHDDGKPSQNKDNFSLE